MQRTRMSPRPDRSSNWARLLSCAAVALMGAGASAANAGNLAEIEQVGTGNSAEIEQVGSQNTTSLIQGDVAVAPPSEITQPTGGFPSFGSGLSGAANSFDVLQSGNDHLIQAVQAGYGNTADLDQSGSKNTIRLFQIGQNNEASIRQEKSRNTAEVTQIGQNFRVDLIQDGSSTTGSVGEMKVESDVPKITVTQTPIGTTYR